MYSVLIHLVNVLVQCSYTFSERFMYSVLKHLVNVYVQCSYTFSERLCTVFLYI